MKFKEAINELMKGFRVRNTSWPLRYYWFREGDYIVECEQDLVGNRYHTVTIVELWHHWKCEIPGQTEWEVCGEHGQEQRDTSTGHGESVCAEK